MPGGLKAVERNSDLYDAYLPFAEVPKILRAIRRLWIHYKLPFEFIWYGKWKKNITQYNTVIIFTSELTCHFGWWIKKQNNNIRIIYWYWNKVEKHMMPDDIKGECEKWSFNLLDCEKYGLRFNHQYYFKSFLMNNENKELWDIYFIGHDHNRAEKIIKMYDYCCKEGIRTNFRIISSHKKSMIPDEIIAECDVEYDEIRKGIASSKAVLEILQERQTGCTLRAMEAVFFQKKLITDNPYIVNEAFYSEDNIFVLGKRPIDELKDFLMKDFTGYDERFIELYDVQSWMNNFMKAENTSL